MTDHDDVVRRLSEAYEQEGLEARTRGNNLLKGAKRNQVVYHPDVLVKDSKEDQIVSIVEVETSKAGKSVVGAAILADVYMQIEIEKGRQRLAPSLAFVFYRSSLNLELAEKRLDEVKRQGRLKHLRKILVLTEQDALRHITSLVS